MAIPVHQRLDVSGGAASATFTKIFNDDQDGRFTPYAQTVLIVVTGASTPNWTMDVQGKLHESDTYTNIDIVQIYNDGYGSISNDQVTVNDTTRRVYRIVSPPPLIQIIGTRTAGTLTIYATLSSQDSGYPSVVVQGPAASDAVEAGNPVQVGGSVDTSPAAAVDGDVRRIRVTTTGELLASISALNSSNAVVGVSLANADAMSASRYSLEVIAKEYVVSADGTWDRSSLVGGYEQTTCQESEPDAGAGLVVNMTGSHMSKFAISVQRNDGSASFVIDLQGSANPDMGFTQLVRTTTNGSTTWVVDKACAYMRYNIDTVGAGNQFDITILAAP
jgi:hypothetical protein